MNNLELIDFDNEFPSDSIAVIDFDKQRCRNVEDVGLQECLIDNIHSIFGVEVEEIVDNRNIVVYKDGDSNMGVFLIKKSDFDRFDPSNLSTNVNIPYTGFQLSGEEISFYDYVSDNESRIATDNCINHRDWMKINNLVYYIKTFFRKEDILL